MLIGETGMGKDLLAHTVHELSNRSGGPFVVFDCGAVPANLAESELFGHERGAFTGAVAQHDGAFERANGGTLFLDEVGELPLDLQPRLLRALESRRVRRVGGAPDRSIDVRVVAATNCDLMADVKAGRFRQDLYFRLAAGVVHVPPLRERLDDLPHLLPRLLQDIGRPDLVITPPALDVLRRHRWPGNVRELRNALACASAFAEDGILEPEHLRLNALGRSSLGQISLADRTLAELERAAIEQTLAHVDGNKARAARLLGIALSTLYEKLKKYAV